MEITSVLQALKNFEKAQETRSETEGKRSTVKSKSAKSDSVNLSAKAKLYSKAMLEVQEPPEARREKIDAIKELVESGNYKPDSRKTAEKLVKYDLHLII